MCTTTLKTIYALVLFFHVGLLLPGQIYLDNNHPDHPNQHTQTSSNGITPFISFPEDIIVPGKQDFPQPLIADNVTKSLWATMSNRLRLYFNIFSQDRDFFEKQDPNIKTLLQSRITKPYDQKRIKTLRDLEAKDAQLRVLQHDSNVVNFSLAYATLVALDNKLENNLQRILKDSNIVQQQNVLAYFKELADDPSGPLRYNQKYADHIQRLYAIKHPSKNETRRRERFIRRQIASKKRRDENLSQSKQEILKREDFIRRQIESKQRADAWKAERLSQSQNQD